MANRHGKNRHRSAPFAPRTPDRTPLVSIVIPVHNRLDLTEQCLESLARHADRSIATEIIIVDDCSTDATPDYLRGLGDRVRVFRNDKRQCFGRNMNFAARHARGKYLCLLNNDTYHTACWLTRMVEAIEADPKIGVVGNKHLFPQTGKLNHAGMVFDDHCCPIHLYPGLAPDYPPANQSREFQILTAACWLLPRDLFVEMGGFDEKFKNGYEDVDFCLRLGARQRKVYYCADSVIYHYGQSSPGRTDNDAANAQYFQEKWRGKIRADLHDYTARDARLAQPSPPVPVKKKMVKVDPHPADVHFAIPLEAANSFTWVTSQLVLALDEIGVRVSLKPGKIDASVGSAAKRRLQAMMHRQPSGRVQIKWNHYWEPYLGEELKGAVNAEIFVTNYLYGQRPLHEIDHWMRHTAMNRHRKLPISQFCRDALTELGVPDDRCAVLPLGYSPEILETKEADQRFRKHGFVFLAITNSHDPYRYGADTLLEAYAKAFTAKDDVVLVLKDYGVGVDRSLTAEWLKRFHKGPRVVHLAEFVDKAELIKLYRGAHCFVSPYRGEGFGMKILDACAVGLPVLAPAFGGPADYLIPGGFYPLKHRQVPVGECYDRTHSILPECAHWIEVDADDLAAQFRSVYRDRNEAQKRAQKCQQFVLENFSWRRSAERLREALQRFEGERGQIVAARQQPEAASKRITVVVPTYNRPDALQRCLTAYQKQTLPSHLWEMTVVDDGSKYDVASLVQQHRGSIPLQLQVNAVNAGPAKVRNRGIEMARGAMVLFTGDDIVPEPDFLARHVQAHEAHPEEHIAVLGFIYWHPEIAATPLMNYMTGEGGQQFCFDILKPNSFVPFSCFYTSNVSIKRSLLIDQEDMFSTRFPCAAFEDVELAVRLARRGMRLWYDPKARAGHFHPMTDQQAYDRQYKVGRMLVVYSLLHPEGIVEEHRVFLRWLDVMQHVLLKNADFLKTRDELARFSHSLKSLLDSFSGTVAGLSTAINPHSAVNAPARILLQQENKQWRRLTKLLYAYHFDLAMRTGMADEWMGVSAAEPNPVRDFIRFYLSTGVWNLLGGGTPDSPLPDPHSKAAGRMLRIARNIRHHPWLAPLWTGMTRLPGYRTLRGATKRMLNMLS